MDDRLVWAYAELKELENQVGFVVCPGDIADSLLASGAVQDPQVGALHLKEIGTEAPKPKAKPAAKKTTKKSED